MKAAFLGNCVLQKLSWKRTVDTQLNIEAKKHENQRENLYVQTVFTFQISDRLSICAAFRLRTSHNSLRAHDLNQMVFEDFKITRLAGTCLHCQKDQSLFFIIVYIFSVLFFIFYLLLLLWVFLPIKGYVVLLRAQGLGSRTSECAIKSLDNSSFKVDLYNQTCCCYYKCLLACSLGQVLICRNSAISP